MNARCIWQTLAESEIPEWFLLSGVGLIKLKSKPDKVAGFCVGGSRSFFVSFLQHSRCEVVKKCAP